MKYSQAVAVAVAGAALVAAAPAATRPQSAADVVPAPRDLEDFFERSLDDEFHLNARGHLHGKNEESLPVSTRDLEFDDDLLTREFGFDEELATRDMQQLDARMFEFIFRLFTNPREWWNHHHDHHHHHHHSHGKQVVFPHGHSNDNGTPKSGVPTFNPPTSHKEVKPEAAATPSNATSNASSVPAPQQVPPAPSDTPPNAQAPLSARETAWGKFKSDFHSQRANQKTEEAAKEQAKITSPQSVLGRDYDDLEARILGLNHAKAFAKALLYGSAAPSTSVAPAADSTVPAIRSYDEEELMMRDLLDAADALKKTFARSDLNARSFDDFILDELD